jgi:hypothetical protein
VSAILGIFQGQLQDYLIACEEVLFITELLHQKFYRIEKVRFLGFTQPLDKKNQKQEYRLIRNM